jgi:3D (Asp-Asp-Asp) domain-containing protein
MYKMHRMPGPGQLDFSSALRMRGVPLILLLGFFLFAARCEAQPAEHSLLVTATAYNSVASQTDADPSLGAWGDQLKPGMKIVAVSSDLLEMGLTRGAALRIEGLEDEYAVLDKTGSRHQKRIDIYMGTDIRQARRFGVRKLRIYWSD